MSLALVGLHFGGTVVRQLRAAAPAGVRLAGVCDLDQDLAESIARAAGVTHYPDLSSALADPDIEAVALYTGPAGRSELIRQAINAGKHVMTTKPFEVDPVAAREVLAEAAGLGRVVQLNSPPPRVPADLAQIEAWRDTLDLGRPVGAQAAVWASYQESPDGSWYDDPRRCPAAPVTRLGIYLINDLIRLFGPADQVQVLQRRLRTGRPTADNAHLTIGFPGGAIGTVAASFCVDDGRPYRDRLTVTYERGTITRTRGQAGAATLELVRNGEPDQVRHCADPSTGGYQWDTFARSVHSGAVTAGRAADDIVAGVGVLAAMARAAQSGRIEDVR